MPRYRPVTPTTTPARWCSAMVCHGVITMPKAGVYEQNQHALHLPQGPECSACGIHRGLRGWSRQPA